RPPRDLRSGPTRVHRTASCPHRPSTLMRLERGQRVAQGNVFDLRLGAILHPDEKAQPRGDPQDVEWLRLGDLAKLLQRPLRAGDASEHLQGGENLLLLRRLKRIQGLL